jgi:hypothetical protein
LINTPALISITCVPLKGNKQRSLTRASSRAHKTPSRRFLANTAIVPAAPE